MNADTPTTATRVVLPGLVEPEGLVVESGPLDAPGPGRLLVAVEATGVSYAEQAMRRGRYFGQPEFPFVPGYDLVGTVLQTGPQADASLAGKRVATLTKTGAWTSHAVVEARDSVVVPDGIDPADPETVVVNGVTAWQMLLLAPCGALVGYAIIAGVSGTGGLVMPFVKAIGRILLWNALPNGHRATFYNIWAGHKTRPARFREHLEEDLEEDLGHVFALLADGTLTAGIAARFPLEDAAAALALAESRTVNGKVILLP